MAKQNAKNANSVKRAELMRIVDSIAIEHYAMAANECRKLAAKSSIAWQVNLRKLALVCDAAANGQAAKKFSIIIKKGNVKLGPKFFAFSSLPGEQFCQGAGDCLKACFSFKAWRYPAAFCRQAQNTILMQTDAGRELLAHEYLTIKLPRGQKTVEFRLFVDGDYRDADQAIFFFNLIGQRPEFKVYGYSKSFAAIIVASQFAKTPENYLLNLSGGHKYDKATETQFSKLPVVRGEFLMVGEKTDLEYGSPEYRDAARKAFAATGDTRKPFICPGKCFECTPGGHACGSRKFEKIPIVILTH